MNINELNATLRVVAVCSLLIGAVAVPAGGVVNDGATAIDRSVESDRPYHDTIDPTIRNASGTIEVVVRLADDSAGASAGDVETLKKERQRSQRPLIEYVERSDDVTLRNQFWIANAVLLKVDADSNAIERISSFDHVERIHPNFEIERPKPEVSSVDTAGSKVDDADGTTPTLHGTTTSEAGEQVTYGLDRIGVPAAWERFDTRGEGTKIAVLDTGVDVDHPDIDLYTENESDPTFPGGWAEFDTGGDRIEGSVPRDDGKHGTHVSGTIVGGNHSGTQIGIAPRADLIHGMVLGDSGGRFASVVEGIQWAIEEDADVIVMSFGATTYERQLIEPIREAEKNGVFVVAASGDEGAGLSSSPANVYEAYSVGASDRNDEIIEDSGGEVIDTETAWRRAAPDDWPDTYVVPDIAAPGHEILSATPGGGYARLNGTSMATPHVAGTAALMFSATDNRSGETIELGLTATASVPDGAPSEKDIRYGHGIVDASGALEHVQSGVTITVRSGGESVTRATVEVSDGPTVSTDEDGRVTVPLEPGSHEVTVTGPTIESRTATVTVAEGEYTTLDLDAPTVLHAEVRDDQPEAIEAGDTIEVSLDVTTIDSIAIELLDGYDSHNATLSVNGDEVSFGERVETPNDVDTMTIAVETSEHATGKIRLEHTLTGANQETEIVTGPSTVSRSIKQVAVVDVPTGHAQDIAGSLDQTLPAEYEVETVGASFAPTVIDEYDGFVVNDFGSIRVAESFFEEVDDDTGIVLLDQGGEESDAVSQLSAVTGWPESTGERAGAEPVEFDIETEHPILDGVGTAGDTVPVHTGDVPGQTWVTGIGDATTVARVGDDPGVGGPAIVVNESNNVVLASSLGRIQVIPDGAFTEESDRILGNAVEYTAADATTAPSAEANLTVTDASAPAGGTATVAVTTDADGVAGYQARLGFDPDLVDVMEVRGVDFEDPVTNVDSDAGWIGVAQATATPTDEPTLVEITFEATGERNASTAVTLDPGKSLVNDVSGEALPADVRNGSVEILPCTAGDADGDGSITSGDATLSQRHIVDKSVDDRFDRRCADITGDGRVTSADVTAILRTIVEADEAAT